jgi:hypothetical protein
MKFHASFVQKLIYLMKNYGGHKDEKKLHEEIDKLVMSPYLQQNGSMVVVDAHLLLEERRARNLPVGDVIPMKFHPSAKKKIMDYYAMYSGYQNEQRLVNHLLELDFTTYERTIEKQGEVILVLTSDYLDVLRASNRRE